MRLYVTDLYMINSRIQTDKKCGNLQVSIKKNYLKYCNLDGCLNFRNACASSCLTLSLVTPIIDAISSKVKHLPGSFLEIQSQAFLSLTSHEPKKEGILIFLILEGTDTYLR